MADPGPAALAMAALVKVEEVKGKVAFAEVLVGRFVDIINKTQEDGL